MSIAPDHSRDTCCEYILSRPPLRLSAFACVAPVLWNNLHFALPTGDNINYFKTVFKTFLITQYHNVLKS